MLVAQVDERPFGGVRGQVAKNIFKADDHVEPFISADQGGGDDPQGLQMIAPDVQEKGLALLIIALAFWVDEEVEGASSLNAFLGGVAFHHDGEAVARTALLGDNNGSSQSYG